MDNCIGIADGTLLGLYAKPAQEDFSDFYGRKGNYTITCMVICDDKKRIRYYNASWPGCVHKERVYQCTAPCMFPKDIFFG